MRNGDGLLGESKFSHMREKSRMLHRDMLSPVGIQGESKKKPSRRFATEWGMIMRGSAWRNASCCEDRQLANLLFCRE